MFQGKIKSEVLTPASVTGRAIDRLSKVSGASLGLTVVNEAVVGVSPAGRNQIIMEMADYVLVKLLRRPKANDDEGRHRRAIRQRQAIYGAHIGAALLGIEQVVSLVKDGIQPSPANVVTSGIVGIMNGGFIYDAYRHKKGIAHTETPTYELAFSDPVEVIQDEMRKLPDADTAHRMTKNGTTAIATTNIIEAIGGFAGAFAQIYMEQGAAAAAVASSVGVIAVMGRQIECEQQLL